MNFICTKKLSLGGTDYRPGDVIPDGAFTGDRAKKLKSFGYIADAIKAVQYVSATLSETQSVEMLSVTLNVGEDGEKAACPITGEQLQAAVDIMQKSSEADAEAIEDEVDETVLTFVARVDSRKAVKGAAERQLGVIASVRGSSGAPTEGSGEAQESEQ